MDGSKVRQLEGDNNMGIEIKILSHLAVDIQCLKHGKSNDGPKWDWNKKKSVQSLCLPHEK